MTFPMHPPNVAALILVVYMPQVQSDSDGGSQVGERTVTPPHRNTYSVPIPVQCDIESSMP